MVKSSCNCLRRFLILLEAWIVGSECADMLHNDIIGFGAEPEYFEATKSQHLVMVLTIIDRHESIEELLFRWEGNVSCHPVFCIAHL